MGIVDVAPPPEHHSDPVVGGSSREVTYESGHLRCHGDLTKGDSLRRPTTHEVTEEVLSWLRVSPALAWSCLYCAIPDFWLNRFRRTTDWTQVETTDHKIDLAKLISKRQLQRADLGHHALSLRSKIWALKHHRNGFRAALTDYKENRNRELALVTLTAEFCAHDAATYSLLEELARLLSLVTLISEGKETPLSFHELHKKRETAADDELRSILDSIEWFEPFRRRRANTSHSFTAMLHPDAETEAVVLAQRVDPRLRGGPREEPAVVITAGEVFEQFVTGTETFLSKFSIYLLRKFTPYDLVTLQFATHDDLSNFKATTVWTRRLIFDPRLANPSDGEAIIASDGSVRIRGTSAGGFHRTG